MAYDAEYWQEMIDEIMDNFDFQKVRIVMIALDWRWRDEVVPDLPELRRAARKLLKHCVKEVKNMGTGGFGAIIDCENGVLSLEFVVESWDAYKE